MPATSKIKQGGGKLRIWNALIVKWWSFKISTKFEKNLLCFTFERDISSYIFQNIIQKKLIAIHEQILDIITNS